MNSGICGLLVEGICVAVASLKLMSHETKLDDIPEVKAKFKDDGDRWVRDSLSFGFGCLVCMSRCVRCVCVHDMQ